MRWKGSDCEGAAYLKNGGTLEKAAAMAGRRSFTIGAATRRVSIMLSSRKARLRRGRALLAAIELGILQLESSRR
jgi:hypothetical protein